MYTMRVLKSGIDPVSKTEEIFFDNGDTLPPHFNVDSKDIKEGKKIGEGLWTVREADWLGRKVAVKKFDVDSTFGNVSLTSREVNRMLSLQHPNVLNILGFYLTTKKEQVLECTMIMELMDYDLEDYIERGALLDEQVVYICAEIARGMNHIHKKGCFHRDLKPKNVLLKESLVTGFNVDVKIADFGSSELMGVGDINRNAGTFGYKAPEQFDPKSKVFPNKVDVFGFGALCFKILTGREPYECRENVRETIEQIDKTMLSQQNLSEDIVEMIWKCLDVNPDLRPNFKEISHILDHALLAIRERMAEPLPLPTSPSLHSKEFMPKRVQGHGDLESILLLMGLSKEYAIRFIPFEELLVISLIGEGSHGSIYKVQWKGILFAQKIFDKFNVRGGSSPLDNLSMRKYYFQTFPKLFHKNIVTFMGYSVTQDYRISIIMELETMDLSKVLGSSRFRGRKLHLNIKKKWMIMKGIVEGMKYLHDQGVVHGDLKPGNVVVSALESGDMIVKLIDFANDPLGCTFRYAAPEILKCRNSSMSKDIDAKKSDVYSFGILCLEILGGSIDFEAYQPNNVEATLKGEKLPIAIGTSLEMECLLKSCLSKDPQERPNFSEVHRRWSRTLHHQPYPGHNNQEGLSTSKTCSSLQKN